MSENLHILETKEIEKIILFLLEDMPGPVEYNGINVIDYYKELIKRKNNIIADCLNNQFRDH